MGKDILWWGPISKNELGLVSLDILCIIRESGSSIVEEPSIFTSTRASLKTVTMASVVFSTMISAEWDSLSFIAVFNAISEILDVELEDDDAIHFTSIPAMHAFLNEIMEE